jgi:hypothetical protein
MLNAPVHIRAYELHIGVTGNSLWQSTLIRHVDHCQRTYSKEGAVRSLRKSSQTWQNAHSH